MCDPYESLVYSFDPAFKLLGRRWATEILFQIIGGRVRYSQLQRALPGISPRTLSVRVSEMEETGVITKGRRNNVECVYALTEKGYEIKEVLDRIATLSIQWHNPNREQ
jgi:DNA-binding HxlR family transcriptional regulator